jgi:Flp pilus assembly protein TadG
VRWKELMTSKFTAAHRKAIPDTSRAANVGAGARERMRSLNRRRLHQRGQAVLEFALGLPLLLALITGLVMFGVAFNNELTLTYATDAAAQLLSISRGQTTDPCQTTANAFYSSAPYLTASNLAFSIALNGHSYAGTTCSGAQLVASETAQVTVTYPCTIGIFGFAISNFNLTAQTTALIQ